MFTIKSKNLTHKDIRSVVKTLKSDFLTQGPKIEEFEKKFAKYVGSRFALAVSNCSAGLFLAVKSLELKKNDTVLTTPITFISTANAGLYNNCKVAVSDVDTKNCLMSVTEIKKIWLNFPQQKL